MGIKILTIGVDGATFNLIKPWAQKGLLPNFKNLLEKGVYGELESTLPPITGPAWASFQTGKNPGQHAIFDWLTREKSSYRLKPISTDSINSQTLWKIISDQGKKVGVINVPLTYPPREVNGFLVSGILAPSKKNEFTYPSQLKAEIEKDFSDYEILPKEQFNRYKIDKWIAALKKMIIERKKLTLHLLKTREWDFAMVHFVATDIIQHRMWHKTKDDFNNNCVLDIYKEIDRAIGEIISILPENSCIFIISDHGFGPLYNNIYLNNWLLKNGYLKLKSNFFTKFKALFFRIGITPGNAYKILEKLGLLGRGLALGKGQRYNLISKFFLCSDNIDWQKTKAYSYGNIGQIYINTVGREPLGCVEEEDKKKLIDDIIYQLKEARHPKTNDYLFDKIYKKEDIYSGDKFEEAPEIVILPKNMEAMAVGVSEFVSNKIVEPSFAFTGGHRMEGIFIGAGKMIKKGVEIRDAKIIDLAPTILYSLGLAIPNDMDGQVLKDIFTDEFLKNNSLRYIDKKPKEDRSKGKEAFKEKEELEIRKKLKDLGYV